MTTNFPSVFDAKTVEQLTERINRLTPASTPQWGVMTVDQMLAHANVTYAMIYEAPGPRPNWLMRLVLQKVVKGKVVGPAPYPRNSPTAPVFRMRGPKDYDAEKARLLAYLQRVQQEGAGAFEGRESPSFGPLTADEWNGLFYKHLDHHLVQFGV